MMHNIAVDIGTSGVRMAVRGHGVVYRQSSAIARRGEDLLEAGNEALRLMSRVPPDIGVSFPIAGGLASDEGALSMWLRYLLRHAQGSGAMHKPRLLMSVAPDMQATPLRHMVALALEAGYGTCTVVRSDLAAAIGAPVDIYQPRGVLLCQLGAGVMSVTALSGGRIVASRSLPQGFGQVDSAIVRRLRRLHGIIIGLKAAEDLKQSLTSAGAAAAPVAQVPVISAKTGFPLQFEVQRADIKDAAEPVLALFCELVHQVLELVPCEFAADIADGGLILTGGGAQLFGLPQRVAEEFELPCHVVDDPSASVVRGLSQIMENRDKYDALLTTHLDVLQRGTM